MKRVVWCLVVVFANRNSCRKASTSVAYVIRNLPSCNFPNIKSRSQRRYQGEYSMMSLIRPSIAGRLLRAGARPSTLAVPSTKRFDTTTAAGTTLTTSTPAQVSRATPEIGKEVSKPSNQPDYAAEVDQASSYVQLLQNGAGRDCVKERGVALIGLPVGPSPQSQSVL